MISVYFPDMVESNEVCALHVGLAPSLISNQVRFSFDSTDFSEYLSAKVANRNSLD